MALIRPGGIPRPNALAQARGLSFALDFADPSATPWIRGEGGVVPGDFVSGGVRDIAPLGPALMGNTGYWGTESGVTYSYPTTTGTVLVATTVDFDSGSGDERMLISGVNNFPFGPGVEILRYSDGNCYFGWISGSNKRITFSGAGLWSAGDTLTLGVTWDADGQVAYVNGSVVGSNALTGFSSTASTPFNIGRLSTYTTWQWIKSSTGAIYYALIFDQALTPAEMAMANRDLWWWVEQAPARPSRSASAVVDVSVSLTGIALTSSAGTLVANHANPLSGLAITGSAGTVVPQHTSAISGSAGTLAAGTVIAEHGVSLTGGVGTASPGTVGYGTSLPLAGSPVTSSAGALGIGLAVTIAGNALTLSAGSLAYSATFSLVGIATTGSAGTVGTSGGGGGNVSAALVGLSIAVSPGNVRVTGGTKWVPQAARAVAIATAAGNMLPPPPRLTGDAKADIQAQGQWLATLYDQLVKVNNVFGRINDHETRIAALEASNDN